MHKKCFVNFNKNILQNIELYDIIGRSGLE